MKMRVLLALPFVLVAAIVVLAACHCRLVDESWVSVSFLAGLLACLACVPVLSRRRLLLGYLGLAYPVVMLLLLGALQPPDTHTEATINILAPTAAKAPSHP